MVDGAENHDNGANSNGLVDPNIDAIAEVKLDTSSYSAEFGGRAGATINLVTKSGTKEFHGTLFEFVRNDAFDARSFFAAKVDPLRFNDFGGTIGGPVFIPGSSIRKSDKLFFFFSEEWKYMRQGQNSVNIVPNRGSSARAIFVVPLWPLRSIPTHGHAVPGSNRARSPAGQRTVRCCSSHIRSRISRARRQLRCKRHRHDRLSRGIAPPGLQHLAKDATLLPVHERQVVTRVSVPQQYA